MSISSIRLEAPEYQIKRRALLLPRANVVAVGIAKRAIDLFVAAVGLLFGSPVFALVAVAIRLDSPGPILYRQRRAGALEGRRPDGCAKFAEFEMLKFRSMRVDAEKFTGAV